MRSAATWVATVLILIAAFILAPPFLAGDGYGTAFGNQPLIDAATSGFDEYWRSGHRDPPAALQDVVDYWFRYHLIKAIVAAALLVALVLLGRSLIRRLRSPDEQANPSRRRLWAAGAGVTGLLGVGSVIALAANIQGVVAPLSSLLSLVPSDHAPPDRDALDDPASLATHPPLDAMVDDFARYHVAMAVMACLLTVAMAVMTVVWWRSLSPNTEGLQRRDRFIGLAAAVVMIGCLLVVTLANVGTAVAPAGALASFFGAR